MTGLGRRGRRPHRRPCLRAARRHLGRRRDGGFPLDMTFLGHVATRITEVKGVNCVTYDITSKPPGTIKWE